MTSRQDVGCNFTFAFMSYHVEDTFGHKIKLVMEVLMTALALRKQNTHIRQMGRVFNIKSASTHKTTML
jgi:hypothetical protein